jgi:hypothetical protein
VLRCCVYRVSLIACFPFLLVAPKNYGDRLHLAGDAMSPVQVLHHQVALDGLSAEQLDALERLATALLVEQR